jgi:hypothetical protein
MLTDTYGMLHPAYTEGVTKRFKIVIDEHDPAEEAGWRYKLRFTDHKYQDSEGYPIDSVCAGDSWSEAFARAAVWIDQALNTDHCIF